MVFYITISTATDDRSYTNGDQVVMVHSNRVCLVSLAPSHPVVKDQVRDSNKHLDVSLNEYEVRVY